MKERLQKRVGRKPVNDASLGREMNEALNRTIAKKGIAGSPWRRQITAEFERSAHFGRKAKNGE